MTRNPKLKDGLAVWTVGGPTWSPVAAPYLPLTPRLNVTRRTPWRAAPTAPRACNGLAGRAL